MAFRPPVSESGASTGLRHIRTKSRRLVTQSGRLVARSRGRSRRAQPVAARGLETRLSAILEPHDLRARHRLRPGSDPYEMEMHLASSLRMGRRAPPFSESARREVGD